MFALLDCVLCCMFSLCLPAVGESDVKSHILSNRLFCMIHVSYIKVHVTLRKNVRVFICKSIYQ